MSDMYNKFYKEQQEREGKDWSYCEELTKQGLPMKRFETFYYGIITTIKGSFYLF